MAEVDGKEPESKTGEAGKDEKKEKKLYKGEVKPVAKLVEEVRSATPMQAVKQQFKLNGYTHKLPPTFLVTRFSPGYFPGSHMMHYYNPASKQVAQMEVPPDVELNVLAGTRGKEIRAEWEGKVQSELGSISRRMACTVGTDPEIFVTRGEEVVPAWTFLGSKKKPDTYEGSYYGDLYWDGFQAEFTTPGTITCLIELSAAIRSALKALHKKLPKGTKLSIASVVPVDPEVLSSAKEEHVEFGCAPSKNVYGLKGNMESGRNVAYRFAGGHIHLAMTDADKARIPEFVRALDSVLGVAAVSLFAGYDSPIRRRFYGQAGEYRTPPHGLEYRVLSNAWLSHPAVMHMVFDLTRAICGVVQTGIDLPSLWKTGEEETIRAIQENNVELARKILDENRRVFTQILYTAGSAYQNNDAFDIWSKGMDSLVKDPKDIAGNWNLDSESTWHHYETPRTFSVAVRRFREGKKV